MYMSLPYCCCVTALCVAAVFAAELRRVRLINDRIEQKFRFIFPCGNLNSGIDNAEAASLTAKPRLDGKTPSVRPIE
jgi:hypothetical protein